jgi:hypothetical protein
LWKRQTLLIIENLAEKRQFMNLYRMMFPDWWVQETGKIVKFFIMSTDENDVVTDWKELFMRRFDGKLKNCYVTSGQEGLASDYKLLKHPIGQLMLGLKCVVLEFGNHSDALEAYL